MNYITDTHTRTGTLGGTLLVVILNIDSMQLLSTIIMAATGAVVSFVMSVFCKYLWKRIGKK
jgi:hypothetical protein